LDDVCGTGPHKCCQCFKMKTTECCKTIHTGRQPYVFHQIDTHNNRPVYKGADEGDGELCMYYKEQWIITTCEAFYNNKTENSRWFPMLSKTNVDCPHQVEVGDWYEAARPDHHDAKKLSFSCGSKSTECCKYLRNDNVVFSQGPDYFNNRPSYGERVKDKKKNYILYLRNQWIITNCTSAELYSKNCNKGVLFYSRANVDCPNLVGDMYWYTPDGKQTNFSISCTGKKSKSLQDVTRPFGGY